MGAMGIVVAMASAQPLVTVGMAVYKGEKYIAEAISSVLAETYQNWELLLVNDCSPDSSIEVAAAFTDPRIRVLNNETNLGLVDVRNKIMNEARGTYVAWLDQDDLTLPARLTTQVRFLEANPNYSLCGSWTKTRTESPDGSVQLTTKHLPCSHDEVRAAMLFLNPIACNTVTLRRDDFMSHGFMFRPPFGNSLDYDLWSIASDELRMCNLPHALAIYRAHSNQTSQGAALEKMHGHALDIQSGLAHRALGIDMSAQDRSTHRSATTAPVLLTDAIQMAAIAEWFARLRAANQDIQAFDGVDFDAALARQWTTVVVASARSEIPKQDVIRQAMIGVRQIGLPLSALARSSSAGLRRRAARR